MPASASAPVAGSGTAAAATQPPPAVIVPSVADDGNDHGMEGVAKIGKPGTLFFNYVEDVVSTDTNPLITEEIVREPQIFNISLEKMIEGIKEFKLTKKSITTNRISISGVERCKYCSFS